MSSFTDIANWVVGDYLNRSDLLSVAQTASVNFYKMICAKIPFDQLMTTSPELPVVSGTDTYDLTLGTTQVWPPLRSIASNRFTFTAGQNSRRLRRSHVRVYDSLTFTQPGLTATYARWGNSLIFNPPPNSSSYTFRLRYWQYPVLGLTGIITNASWAGSVATITAANTFTNGDTVQVSGVLPAGYNGVFTLTSASSTQFTYALSVNPGTYVVGGMANDISASVVNVTQLVTPAEWDELMKWETLYRVYMYLDQLDKASALVQPQPLPRQASPKKTVMYEVGIIPRLWNDLLTTISQQENVDEDFSINPVIRAYTFR
jgi:hypothetical protein